MHRRSAVPPPIAPAHPPVRGLGWRTLALSAGGALAWAAGALAVAALGERADLGSQALPLVLAAALASLWWPMWACGLACALATLAFNWFCVPPRGSLHVAQHRDMLLLLTLVGVSVSVAVLVARQRRLAAVAAQQGQQIGQLHQLSQRLREADSPPAFLAALSDALVGLGLPPATALEWRDAIGHWQMLDGTTAGPPLSADETQGLQLCAEQSQAFGAGSGRFDNLPAWYVPLRATAKGSAPAALLLRWPSAEAVPGSAGPPIGSHPDRSALLWPRAQALADLTGQALAAWLSRQQAAHAEQHAQAHQLRNTVLTAVSHDYRTPLATILGAASSLMEQGERLAPASRNQLLAQIVDEVQQLSRLTDNALQLARLESLRPIAAQAPEAAPHPALTLEWESAEELVGAVAARLRARDPQQRLRVRLAGPLPLLRCNGVLVVQALENLLDNALKYSPPGSPVQLQARRLPDGLLLAVRDRGPGVQPAWRDRIFQAFERGPVPSGATADSHHPVTNPVDAPASTQRRGAGLGLALCRAVALAHGGQLRYRPRAAPGGSSFELLLPLREEAPPCP